MHPRIASIALLLAACTPSPSSRQVSSASDSAAGGGEVLFEVERQKSLELPTSIGVIRQIQDVCAGQLPAGWALVNDHWDPMSCGNPSNIIYNVWTIERYDDKPVGTLMSVCAGQAPRGWARINDSWDPMRCGRPTSTMIRNVMTMRRLN